MFRRFFLFGLYAIVLTATLLYVRFPGESFRRYCERQLLAGLPGWESARIATLAFRPPAGLVAGGIVLTGRVEGAPATLAAEHVVLTATAWPPNRHLQLVADLYGGRLTADLAVSLATDRRVAGEVRLADLDLTRLLADYPLSEREMAGTLGFTGSYQATWALPLSGQGQDRLTVGPGKIGLLQPVLSLAALDFAGVSAEVELSGEELQLRQGLLTGNEVDADFSGTVGLLFPLAESGLLLQGELRPKEAYLQANPREQMLVERLQRRYNSPALPFQVGGTLARPTFRFGGE